MELDIFKDDAFSVVEMGEAVNLIPNQWGRIGEMGLFTPKPIRTATFTVELKGGRLQLVQSSMRGTKPNTRQRGKRSLKAFMTSRFALTDRITADDVADIRPFGKSNELMQVIDEVNNRQIDLRGDIDITREYLRSGAIAGLVKDADGTTIIDLFAEFGVTQKSIDFKLGTTSEDIATHARQVLNHIDLNMKGDVKTGVHCLCSQGFFDKLLANAEFKDAYKYYKNSIEPLRDDSREGVYWQGITWEQYLGEADVPQEDGTFLSQSFIEAGKARFFPTGTRNTFRQFNAPADYMQTVNTLGEEFYSKLIHDPDDRFVDVEAQMNTLPMCMRPAVLVEGTSST